MWDKLKNPLITLFLCVLFTWALYGDAKKAEAGIEPDFTGRRSGTKRLFYATASALGTTGVLGIGVTASLASVAWAVVAAKNSVNASK